MSTQDSIETQFPGCTKSPQNNSLIGIWNRWWFGETVEAEERRLVLKLDLFLLVFVCCDFFVKYLDQTNITNAYVSGMKEDLKLHGNELNWLSTLFNIGVIVGSPVGTWMITIVRPRYWLPGLIVVWSVLVVCLHVCKNISQLYAVRFLVGMVEASAFPGCFYLIGSWYTRYEINRRMQTYMASSILGAMLSGFIQAGLYENMQGRRGLAAWQWLFIFDAIIGVPVAIYGFLVLPDTPETTKIWWLNEMESKLAVERLNKEGRGNTSTFSDVFSKHELSFYYDKILHLVTSWQFYLYPFSYALWQCTCGTANMRFLALFLKSVRKTNRKLLYTIPEVNVYSSMVGLTTIFIMILTGIMIDSMKWKYSRQLVIALLGCSMIFGYAVLTAWPSSLKFRIAAFYFISAYESFGPLISANLALNCKNDDFVRSWTTGFMVALGYAVGTPAQQYMFPTSQKPQYKRAHGYPIATAFAVATTVWTIIGLPFAEQYFQKREEAKAVSVAHIECISDAVDQELYLNFSGNQKNDTKIQITSDEL